MNKKEVEKQVVEKFLKLRFGINGVLKLTYQEKPDAAFEYCGESIGLEVTMFPIVSGEIYSSIQKQSHLQKLCIKAAYELATDEWKKYEIIFSFNFESPIKRYKELAKRVVNELSKISFTEVKDGLHYVHLCIPELQFVYVVGKYHDSKWFIDDVMVSSTNTNSISIQEIINKKCDKFREYQKYDQNWLLIWLNYFDYSHNNEYRDDGCFVFDPNVFDEVILFRCHFDHYEVLYKKVNF